MRVRLEPRLEQGGREREVLRDGKKSRETGHDGRYLELLKGGKEECYE